MPFKTHYLDPESHTATRCAYDPETKSLWIEFKPNLKTYRYTVDSDFHFGHISTLKAKHAEQIRSEPDAVIPDFDELGCKPGSEGSYIQRKIVVVRKGPGPFNATPLSAEESAGIYEDAKTTETEA